MNKNELKIKHPDLYNQLEEEKNILLKLQNEKDVEWLLNMVEANKPYDDLSQDERDKFVDIIMGRIKQAGDHNE